MRRHAPLVLTGQAPSFVAGSPLTTPHSHAWCAAAITEHGDDYLGTAPVSSTDKFVELIYDLLRGGGRRRPARDRSAGTRSCPRPVTPPRKTHRGRPRIPQACLSAKAP